MLRQKTLANTNFNPRAPCGARRGYDQAVEMTTDISTHAPLAGRDTATTSPVGMIGTDFNPRAPCGARPRGIVLKSRLEYFNPRAPCGARQWQLLNVRGASEISTHAPLAGRDFVGIEPIGVRGRFQPTRPLRGATGCEFDGKKYTAYISTHAPLAGRDWSTKAMP